MLRVLLVIEDYNELSYLQTLLRKVGFDVDAIQSSRKFEETYLSFNPQILIMTASGKMVNGKAVAAKINKHKDFPKIVLVANQKMDKKEELSSNIDEIINSPVNIRALLELMSRYGNIDFESIITKLQLLVSTDDGAKDTIVVKGDGKVNSAIVPGSSSLSEKMSSSMSDQERQKRFQDFLIKEEISSATFDKGDVKKATKKIREISYDQSLDDAKKEYVKALFKKDD